MNIFEKLRAGEPVDMMSEEYAAAITELRRADKALFHLNHSEPGSEEQRKAFEELFDGEIPQGLGIFTPTQIDFPKQITFGNHVFINHSFTAMSIGGITLEDNVQIGPHVTIATDNHDFKNRYVLKCKPVLALTHSTSMVWFSFPISEIVIFVLSLVFLRGIYREYLEDGRAPAKEMLNAGSVADIM